MEQRDVDIAIIGAGTAGLSAWHTASKHSESVVLIEGGAHGTTCARVGCMPSKLLIAAAEAAHQARTAAGFGIRVGGVEVDGQAVMARVKQQRDRFVGGVLDSLQRIPEANRLQGHARFEDPHTLLVGEHTRVQARTIIIATGSRATWPSMFDAAGDRLVTNEDIFEWRGLPESVAVFGPGVIGLELGQALHRLGVRLRMFGVSGSLGPFRDDRVRDTADATFNEEFYVDPGARVEKIERDGDAVVITFIERESGETLTERFDYLLAATGRRPNVDCLDLENAGLALDDQGVPHFNRFTLQCQNADASFGHIFIAGDANQELPLLHEANGEGRIAGDNAGRFPELRAGRRNVPLAIVFTDPQMATVGEGYAELEKRLGGRDQVAVGEASFDNQGRAVVLRRNRGLMRLYAEHGSSQFLGAELFGPQMEHIAHLLAWALEQKLGVAEMIAMPWYHPVLEEGLRSALRDLNANLQLGPAVIDRCMECGPGD
ncbi:MULTISPECIES: dihydrolipoyl dehydrogenase [unclassified Halomonas]|uniref:dihydrolipoyl dehydrogenase n=1 Tax=unclassified Halomonas TaxID=2609666 RepID=UPI0028858170|nr:MULTISPECIES: dihydrolipoyl dehydrogenase [unclassified Halomonas]MDT0501724.1 dihydrolipoyl dehydrogenase [Halomonas sp. PAR7]MDT0513446.1 dihydrolipoyl dehydrogenase [Halomonas sp. LES1]MDT0591787.1 dihydrolipoyl dehydrogenase [Halomonas sp. PAR8]